MKYAIKNKTTGMYRNDGGSWSTAEYRQEYDEKLKALHALLDVRAANPGESFALVRIPKEQCAPPAVAKEPLYFVYDENDTSDGGITRYVCRTTATDRGWSWCSEAFRSELPKAEAAALRDMVSDYSGIRIAAVADGVPEKLSLYDRVVEGMREAGFATAGTGSSYTDTMAKLLCEEIEGRLKALGEQV